LIGIEDREPLEEWDGLGIFAGFDSALLLVVRHKAIGIDDGGTALTLADVTAKTERLAEREPTLAGEAALDDGAPQDQHIDSGIAALGRDILRHRERRVRCRGPPRLNPGHAACFQFADDLVGDFLIKPGAVLTGTGASGESGHRGSPRRAPRASLAAWNPSRETRPHSRSPAATLQSARADSKLRNDPQAPASGMDARRVKTRHGRGFSEADSPARRATP
jgi:hypothetical protein